MSNKLCVLGLTLTLSVLIISGCATPTAEPVGPSTGESEYCVDKATGAQMSYQEAVEIAQNSECTAQGGLKETHFCNESTGTWWIDLDIEKPGCMPACVIKVSDKTAEINWRCTGAVPPEDTATVLGPDRARDAALDYIFDRYGEVVFPPPGSDWTEENVTGEGLVGASTFRYTAADLVVTVSFPVVNPADTIYQVVVSKEGTGFLWKGEVDAAGQVTEIPTSDAQLPVVAWYGYVASTPTGDQFDDYLVLMPEGTGEIGVEGADETVEAQIVALRDMGEPGKYAHFWGNLACDVLDYGGCQLLVTRLRVDGPGPFFEPNPVEGWEGTLVSGPPGPRSGGDDYFLLTGDFPVQYGVDSVDPAIAAQLESLRDTGAIIRVWGELSAGVIDWNATQVQVTRIEVVGEPAMPTPTAEQPVVGWLGYIVSLPAGSQYNDYFQREDGRRYGVEGADDDMQQRLEAIRTAGARVSVWGQLLSDVPDYEARQIRVERYELAPVTETVDGWLGTIVQLLPGSQYKDCFERDDGQRYGIEGTDDTVREQIEEYRWTGAQVQVWGQLYTDVPAYGGRNIQIERIGAVSGPAAEARNLTPFATTSASSHLPTDRGGQYQSWMAMDGALETSWAEGVAGPGVGEWFMLTFPGTVEIDYINLDVGYDRDADIFFANNRIKRATFIFSNGEQIEATFSDTRGMQMIALARAPGPNIETTYVKVVIEGVFPGSRYDDTCLAEIEVWGRTL